MKLEFELIEDAFDETTHIRTMTEQARTPGGDWLIRTTAYAPHHLAVSMVVMAGNGRDPGGFESIVLP